MQENIEKGNPSECYNENKTVLDNKCCSENKAG